MASTQTPWCCRRCGAPLATVVRKKRIIIHQKQASFFVTGDVVAVCRCLARNQLGGGR